MTTMKRRRRTTTMSTGRILEESFDVDGYYQRLGTRPALEAELLGAAYRRVVELFCLCTEEDPRRRPSAGQIIQALESNNAASANEVIVLD
ncbi:hypothetical protein CRUP_024045 [Coryphaenoides rupestris]|nr:hypothetical protein CRUP_024045 [Coryphaenoides rupestris]